MKLKKQTLDIQKLNLPTNDLTDLKKEKICELYWFEYCGDFHDWFARFKKQNWRLW